MLHCVSNYPCSNASLNLNCIDTLKKYVKNVGFSDHSRDHLSSALAIAKGASIIEKHITLDNNLPGPDHKTSLNLRDFKKFVSQLRKAEIILGTNLKKIQPEEKEMLNISRKGLYYSKNIQIGKKIKKNDLVSLRPFNDTKVSEYKKVINKYLKVEVLKNQSVSIKHFKKIK